MRISLNIKCPGCGLSTGVTCVKPGLLAPVVVRFECCECKSDILAKIYKAKDTPATTQVRVSAKVTRASSVLMQIQAEEAAHTIDGLTEFPGAADGTELK